MTWRGGRRRGLSSILRMLRARNPRRQPRGRPRRSDAADLARRRAKARAPAMAVAAARLEGRGGRRSEASRVAVGRVGVHGLRLCAHWAVWAVQIEHSDSHPRSRKRRLRFLRVCGSNTDRRLQTPTNPGCTPASGTQLTPEPASRQIAEPH